MKIVNYKVRIIADTARFKNITEKYIAPQCTKMTRPTNSNKTIITDENWKYNLIITI